VYTASYAAVPHIVELGAGLEPPHQLMCWAFVGSVARSTDGPPIPDDLRAAYDGALARCEPLIRATLLARRFEAHEVVYLLGAIAAVRGHRGLSYALDYLCDGFEPHCPRCQAQLSVELDSERLFVTVDEPAPPRATRRLPIDWPDPAPGRADPSLPIWAEPRVTEYLLTLAEASGHPDLVTQLIAWEGTATCPACEYDFALRPTLVAQASRP
jgi:hypothetical protein